MTEAAPVAVTGGTGFVGHAVLDALWQSDTAVQALARKVPGDGRAHVEWIAGNLGDMPALERLATGCSAMVHIAGLTNSTDPAQFEAANVTGTANVIAAMKRAGVKRLVFVSSLAARKPELSAYGASKARAEALVEASGLDWTIVRPPGVYGPRDVDYFEMFRSARWGFVPLPPRGASSIIHVTDLAQLLVTLTQNSPATSKHIFEPDDGRTGGWSHKELATAIGKAVGRPVFAPHLPEAFLLAGARLDGLLRGNKARLTRDRVGYMSHPNWVSRSDRAVPENVWTPTISGPEGLQQTADWYRREGWL